MPPTRCVVIVDRRYGPSPFWLQQHPQSLPRLISALAGWRGRFEVRDVPDDVRPAPNTLLIHEVDGIAQVWKDTADSR